MCAALLQSRARSSYFSASAYSSLSGSGADSPSSKPEYRPHEPASVAASAARITNCERGAFCRWRGLMSGVLTKKFGRKNSRGGPAVSSVR